MGWVYLKLGPEPLYPEPVLLRKFMAFFLNLLKGTWGISNTWNMSHFWGDCKGSPQLSDLGFF